MLINSTSVLFACSVGLMSIRYPEMMLKPEVKKLYFEWLARDSDPSKKMQVKITSEVTYCQVYMYVLYLLPLSYTVLYTV